MTAPTFQVEYKPSPVLARILSAMSAGERRQLEAAGAERAAAATRSHLLRLAASRHDTAHALGATPTGVVRTTADNTRKEERDGSAFVVVPHPMFRRAFRDVEIAPKTKAALAIPVHKAAYGKSPASDTHDDFFVWRKKDGGGGGQAFLARTEGKRPAKLVLYYLLYRGKITQKQDPTLLPSREALAQAAGKGVARALREKLETNRRHA